MQSSLQPAARSRQARRSSKDPSWRSESSSEGAVPGRHRRDFTGLVVGYTKVLRALGENWECACTICGGIFMRTHKKLTLAANQKAGSYCGECLGPRYGRRTPPVEHAGRRLPSLEERRSKVLATMLPRLAREAKRRGLGWFLEVNDLREIIFQPCSYCGLMGRRNEQGIEYNGIDRLDSSLPYTRENCVAACFTCNRAKGQMTVDEFKGWISRVKAA